MCSSIIPIFSFKIIFSINYYDNCLVATANQLTYVFYELSKCDSTIFFTTIVSCDVTSLRTQLTILISRITATLKIEFYTQF